MMRICRRGFIDSNLSTIMSTMSTSESFLLVWKRNSHTFLILLFTRPLVSETGYFVGLITQNFLWSISDQELSKWSPLSIKNSSPAINHVEQETSVALFGKNIPWAPNGKSLSKARKSFLSTTSSQQDTQRILLASSSKKLVHKR